MEDRQILNDYKPHVVNYKDYIIMPGATVYSKNNTTRNSTYSSNWLWMIMYEEKDSLNKPHKHSEFNLSIGCVIKTIEAWDYFFSDKSEEEFTTPRNTLKWKLIRKRYFHFKKELIRKNIIK